MTNHLIKPCALAYLNQWHKTDQHIFAGFAKSKSLPVLANALQLLAAKYQVARNFPVKAISKNHGEEDVTKRWHQAAQAVQDVQFSERDHARIVHDLANELGTIFYFAGGNKAKATLISAATKFLWFKGHTDIRIYDKRAVQALNPMQKKRALSEGKTGWRVDGDYALYARAWHQEYVEREPEIITAITELPSQFDWSIVPAGEDREKALAEMKTGRFRERVFDRLLWTIGEADKDDLQ